AHGSERALRDAAERNDALRHLVDVLLQLFAELVEQLVQRYEARPLDVPMRLLRLQVQVDRAGETDVQQVDVALAGLGRQVDAGLVHCSILTQTGDATPFCRSARIPSMR